MAFGQMDPARLRGDALRRWYLRSPSDIEEERRQKAASAYDVFFTPPTTNRTFEQSPTSEGAKGDGSWSSWQQRDDGRWRGERARTDSLSSHGQYQLAAASPRGFWDYWSPKGCQNCHGYTPETLPPIGGRSPFPPNYSPRTGGGSGDSARPRDEWSDRPQCNQQFETDRIVCQGAKSPKCWENQNKRLSHCSATGEVGTPALGFGRPGR